MQGARESRGAGGKAKEEEQEERRTRRKKSKKKRLKREPTQPPSRRRLSEISRRQFSPSLPSSLSSHLSARVPAPFPLVRPARPGGRGQVAQAEALSRGCLSSSGSGEDDGPGDGDDDRRRASRRRRPRRRRRRQRERRAAVGRDRGHLLWVFGFEMIETTKMRVLGGVVSGFEGRKRARRSGERGTRD